MNEFDPAYLSTLKGVSDTILASDLPAILANPALLNEVDNAATALGTTYIKLLNQIDFVIKSCESTCNDCYQLVTDALNASQEQAAANVSSLQAIVQDKYLGCAANIISSIGSSFTSSCKTLDQVKSTLKPGQFALIANCYPDASKWPYSSISFPLYFPSQWSQYAIDSQGNIADGQRLNPDFSWSFVDGSTIKPPDSASVQILLNGPASVPLGKSFDATKVVANYVCGTICEPTINPPTNPVPASVSTVPVMSNPVPVQIQPVPNPVSTPLPVATVPINAPSTTIVNEANNCPAPIVQCPSPQVIVNVSPTPITINAGGSASSVGGLSSDEMRFAKRRLNGEVISQDDLIKEYLRVSGYPEEFVQWFGDITEGEELGFEEQDIEEDIVTLIKEVY